MGKFIIKYDREHCIEAGVCETMKPEVWAINQADWKADLKGGIQKGDGTFELEVDEVDEKLIDSAKGCPANVIRIFEKETGEQIV